ncbi:MAG: hypothetical protein ACRD63_01895 [Pyrinomonadaceae bacterium]
MMVVSSDPLSGAAPGEQNLHNKTAAARPFNEALESALAARGLKSNLLHPRDQIEKRILEEYGAIFIAEKSVTPPSVTIFTDEKSVLDFQTSVSVASASFDGTKIELQKAALDALLTARNEALKAGLNITPRGGSEAARRSYKDTVRLWSSRVLPGLEHWALRGRITSQEVARIRQLSTRDQIPAILDLEKQGIYFSRDLTKSILYSVAAPGTSQHLSMLAFDVAEFADARIRTILGTHGWFQTVKSDQPHFTFLGLTEEELPAHGLKKVTIGNQVFWIPNV